MAGIAPCDETQMRSMLGGDAYAAHCIMLCALGSGGYTCARRHAMGSALSQGYVDVCGLRKIHFDYISDIKFWSKAFFGCRKRILLLCVMDCILERSDLSMHFATRCDEIASCRECMRNATSPRWSCRGDGDGRTHNSRAHRVERVRGALRVIPRGKHGWRFTARSK